MVSPLMDAISSVVPIGGVARLGNWLGLLGNKLFSRKLPKYLYHYTDLKSAQNIANFGLQTKYSQDGFLYLTNRSNLSPLQAHIELALSGQKPFPTSLLQIRVQGLKPSIIRRVQGNLSGMGPGGGMEFLFNQNISANRIKIIK